MIILSLATIPIMEVPAIYQTFEKRPREAFNRRGHLLSPMAHHRGIKMIPRETAHTLKGTRHFCSTPVHLPAARLSLAAGQPSPTRTKTVRQTSQRAIRPGIKLRTHHHTSSAPTSFPTPTIT